MAVIFRKDQNAGRTSPGPLVHVPQSPHASTSHRVVGSLIEIRRKRNTYCQARHIVIAQEMLAVVRVAPAMYLVSGEDTQNLGHDQQCLQMLKSHRYSQLSDHNTLITSFLATVSQPNAIAVCGHYGRRSQTGGAGLGGS